MRVRVLGVVVALVLTGAACTSSGGGDQASPSTQQQAQSSSGTSKASTETTAKPGPDDTKPTETKRNKEAKPYRDVIKLSIDDIQDWWSTTLPEVYGQEYKPISDDNLYAATEKKPAPSCSRKGGTGTYDEVHNNAFYCSLGGFVAWDDQDLMPRLYKQYGEYALAMVFAHEWGHAIQDQVGVFGAGLPTFVTENQADCFAGAWTKHALDNKSGGFRATAADLQSALAGMLEFRDQVGTDAREDSAHGSGFDRVNGFQTGFDEGAEKCATWPKDLPTPYALTFTSQTDLDNAGNLPYEDAVQLATADLNAYWTNLLKDTDFKPVDNIVRFAADTNMPKCGSKQYSEEEALGTIFFCVDDNYVAWDEDMLQDVSTSIGDFGVGVLLAKQWTVSVQVQDGQDKDTIESKQGTTQQSCFTGAWARAVLDGDAHNPGTTTDAQGNPKPYVTLSPGDLDEAIQAFLAFSETPDSKGKTQSGSAFDQVKAFRDGFLSDNGPKTCASYSATSSSSSDDETSTTTKSTKSTKTTKTTTDNSQ